MPDQSSFAPLFQNTEPTEAPRTETSAATDLFNSPAYQTAAQEVSKPSISVEDSKRIDALNDIRSKNASDLANSFDNDDTAIVAGYRSNRDLYDSDPSAKQKFLEAYRVARSQPFSVGSAIGGFASGLIHLVPAMAGSALQAGKDVVTGNGDKVLQGSQLAIARTVEDAGKAKDNAVRLLQSIGSGNLSTLPKDDQGWQADFDKAVERDTHLDHIAHGGANLHYTDAEAADVQKNSLVADPLNFIPLEAGAGLVTKAVKGTAAGEKVFQIVNQAGDVIREIPVVSAGGKMISTLSAAARKATEDAAIAAGTKIADAGKAIGSAKGSLAGGLAEMAMRGAAHGIPGAGIAAGAVAPRTLELLGNGLVNTALKSQGVVPWGGVVNTIKAATEAPIVRAAANGAAGALGLHGDPLAAGFTAFGALANAGGNGSQLGQALGSNAALGAAGGLAGEAFHQPAPETLRTAQDVGQSLAERPAAPVEAPAAPVESQPYGIFPGFDEMNAKNLSEAAPEVRDQINKFREQFRDTGAQIFALKPEEYAQALLDHAETENAKNGPLSDDDAQQVLRAADATKGLFTADLKDANGQSHKVILLNQDGSALHHEVGHLVDSLLSPEDRSALRKQVRSAYSPEEIAAAKARYEDLLGDKISEPEAIDELIAENFTKIVAGVPVDKLGAPREASAAMQDALEKAYGTNTDLGFRADPTVGAALAKNLANKKLVTPEPVIREAKPLTTPEGTVVPKETPTAPVIRPREAVGKENIRVTPEQQNEFRGGAAKDNSTEIQLALQDPRNGYTPINVKDHSTISANYGKPIEADYASVKSEKYGAERIERRGEQAVPDAVRQEVQKIFVPYRSETTSKGIQVLAMSLDKVRQNIDTLVGELAAKGATDLSPYKIQNGKLSPAEAHSLVQDVQTYLTNQANGYAGNGQRVSVPEGYYGSIPAENAAFKPTTLPENKAQFINTLMGRDLGPPKTARASANRPVPANISAAQLAQANGRPVEPSLLAKPGATFKTGESIVETNPLRQQMVKRGVSVDGLHEITERLSLNKISNVKGRPDLNFAQPATDLIRAGFMPDTKAPRITNEKVAKVADEYMQSSGLPYHPYDGYAKLPETLGKEIADWYDRADSNPGDPAVRVAYSSLIDQVRRQYDSMVNAGYSIEPWTGKGEPYRSSADMVRDVKDNKHLWFFLTDNGFGSDGKFDVSKNPMLAPTDVVINGKTLLANDLFRAVHDFFGHAKEGYEFGPRGEYNAFLAHSTMFDHSALPALGAETLAQNAWVNFGPHLRRENGSLPVKGDTDFKPLTERPFADQKVTVVPQELLDAALQNAASDRPLKGTQFMPSDEGERGTAKFLYQDTYKNLKGETKVTRYYQTPGTKENPRGYTVDEVTAKSEGFHLGAENEKSKEPYVFAGFQERDNGDPIAMFTLSEEVGGHNAGSTVSRETLLKNGYDVPLPEPETAGVNDGRIRFKPAVKELTSNSKSDSNQDVRKTSNQTKLPDTVGGTLRLVHLSGQSGISKLQLSKFGDAMANPRDLQGLPKIYFFQEGSPVGGDAFWTKGRHMYGTEVSGDRVYDGNKDPLGYWDIVNQEKRDRMLIDKGYDGIAVQTGDNRRVVTLFKDQTVEPLGQFSGGKKIARNLAFKPSTPEENRLAVAKAKVRDYKERFPEAQTLEYSKDAEGNIKLDKDGNPIISKQSYDLYNTPLAKAAGKGIKNEDAKSDAVASAYADKLVGQYDSIKDRPDVMAGSQWYRVARTKIQSVFGNDSLLFAQLLGATSAQTPVADNFRQSIDAYRRFKNGDYDAMVTKYKEGLAKLADGSLMAESGAKTEPAAMKWWIDQHNLIPTKSNGKKFNANSHAVLRVLAGNWAETVAGPKTPNFAGNLAGTTLEATIDVWAARMLHRVGSEQEGKRWRILPDSETGVSDPDFYLGQAAYRKAAAKIGTNPDDLQAVLWFAEKDHWQKKGWTKGAGAEKSDFNYFLDRTKKEGDTAVLDESDKSQQTLAL